MDFLFFNRNHTFCISFNYPASRAARVKYSFIDIANTLCQQTSILCSLKRIKPIINYQRLFTLNIIVTVVVIIVIIVNESFEC